MPLDFPNSPTNGDTYTASGKTWEWNGTSWTLLTLAINIDSAPSGGLSTTTEGAIMIMDIGS